jgi:hypothetical protein
VFEENLRPGSESVIQRAGSADPDPYLNVWIRNTGRKANGNVFFNRTLILQAGLGHWRMFRPHPTMTVPRFSLPVQITSRQASPKLHCTENSKQIFPEMKLRPASFPISTLMYL